MKTSKQRLQELAGLKEESYSHHGVEDIATDLMDELMSDGSLSNVGISLEGLNSQQQRVTLRISREEKILIQE